VSELAFILPIWILFGTNELGFSITLTTVLFMTIWLGSGILELPTGALADRLGRKRVFLIGVALLMWYPLVYALEAPIAIILAVSLLAAFGSALRSGALIPIVHDAFIREKRSDREYHAFLSNERTLSFIARAISGVAGGLLYALDPHTPYIAMFISYALMLLAGLYIVDISERSELHQTQHISQALRAMVHSKPIVMIIGCYIALSLVAEAIWTAFQPFFENDGLRVEMIGAIFSGLALVSALGAYSIRFIMRRIGLLRIQLLIAALMSLTALLLVMPSKMLHVAAVMPIAFAFGLTVPPLTATIQQYVAGKFHSTALSVIGLLAYGLYGVASLYISVVVDIAGIAATRQILCIEALVVTGVLIVYYLGHRHNDIMASSKDTDTISGNEMTAEV